jgi:hypothetical protein
MEYKSGQICPTSGIYSVTHGNPAHGTVEVTVVKGEPFPPCKGQGHDARFKLKYEAKHRKEHEHFQN